MKDSTKCIVPSCRREGYNWGEFCLECGEIRDAMVAVRGEMEPDEVAALIESFLQHAQCPGAWKVAVGNHARRRLIVEKFLTCVPRESGRSRVIEEGQIRWGRNDGGDGGVYTRRESGSWVEQKTGILRTLAQKAKLDVIWRRLKAGKRKAK